MNGLLGVLAAQCRDALAACCRDDCSDAVAPSKCTPARTYRPTRPALLGNLLIATVARTHELPRHVDGAFLVTMMWVP